MGRKGRWAAASATGLVLVLAAPALAAPAELDSAFGTDGVVRVPLHESGGFTYQVSDVAVGADGSSALLGGILRTSPLNTFTQPEFDVAVAKLTPAGRPDESFGSGGVARLALEGFELPARVALDAQGRVVFSANRSNSDSVAAFVGRLTPAGALDPTFGSDGTATIPGSMLSFGHGLAVDDAGRPAVALVLSEPGGRDEDARAGVARLTATGSPDPTFGTNGVATFAGRGAGAFGLARTPAGSYVAAGASTAEGLFVAELDGTGAPVASFGASGITRLPVAGGIGLAVRVTADGGIVVGGMVGQRSGVLARLESDGRPDPSFGVGGIRTVRADDGSPMPVLGLGAGPSGSVVFTGPQQESSAQATVGRLLASGVEDAGFGGDGYVHPLEGLPIVSAGGTALTVGADGKVLAAGLAATDERVDAFAARFRGITAGSPVATGQVRRVAGTDRIATAVELSRRLFAPATDTAGRNTERAVLAAADRFPDALVAAPYAAFANAPLLLTPTNTLDPRVRAELGRVLPQGGVVTLMGGFNAIGVPVEVELRAAGYQVNRIAGNDRYETSVRVAEAFGPTAAVLARGDDFADALAAGPAAAEVNGAVLLTAGRALPDSVATYLGEHPDLPRYAVGAQAAAAEPAAEAVSGTDRYDTAARVAARFFHTPGRTVVASGERFPDALAGGTYAALTGSPLLLSTRASLPAGAEAALRRVRGFHRVITVAGGTTVLTDQVLDAVRQSTT